MSERWPSVSMASQPNRILTVQDDVSDVRRSKLLSGSARISILQKKAIGELYPVVPVSSCAFNVCGSYAHFNFFAIQTSIEQKCKHAPLVLH